MDQTLRDLHRQAASGDVEAEAKLLLERVRAGDLTEEKLKLAAYLGHETARAALGDKSAEQWAELDRPGETYRWFLWLASSDKILSMRVRLALARGFFLPRARMSEREEEMLEAGELWVLKPSQQALDRLYEVSTQPVPDELPDPESVISMSAFHFIDELVQYADDRIPSYLDKPLWAIPSDVLGGEYSDEEFQEMRKLVSAEIFPWALGLGDPVRDRVEASREQVRLFAYVQGCDLEEVAELLSERFARFVEGTEWRSEVWCVNQRDEDDPTLEPGELPDWELGLNLLAQAPNEAYPAEVRKIVAFLGDLRGETGRDFVLGLDGEDRIYIDGSPITDKQLQIMLGA